MAFVNVLIHSVWGTKNHLPYLTGEIKNTVIQHILENARTENICIDSINGSFDHLHCLFFLNADMSVAKVMQMIKGESAFWINKNRIMKMKFKWADEYYAGSISDSHRERVRAYIRNQEAHHKTSSYSEECAKFFNEYQHIVTAKAEQGLEPTSNSDKNVGV
jgi:REP element-mobilizing transposase RayT